MNKAFKIIGALLAVVVVAAGVLAIVFRHELGNIRALPSSFEAKAMCSCLYVQRRSREFCENFARQQTVPVDWRTVDEAQKTVSVRALWETHTARFVSDRYGCVLESGR